MECCFSGRGESNLHFIEREKRERDKEKERKREKGKLWKLIIMQTVRVSREHRTGCIIMVTSIIVDLCSKTL